MGRRVKCPSCGAVVSVPAAPEEEFVEEFDEPEMPALPPVKAKRSTSSSQKSVDKKPVESSPRRSLRDIRIPLWGMIVGPSILSLLVGYYLGREHIKYEMRSAFTQAGEMMQAGFKEAFNPNQLVKDTAEADKQAAFEKQASLPLGKIHPAEGFSIALVDVKIGHTESESMLSDNPRVSEENYLLCTFQVTNTDDRKILHFHDSPPFVGMENFSIIDDVGNKIRGVSFGFSSDLIGAIKTTDDIQPGDQRTHLEVFTIPPDKTEHLILTINLQAFGDEGRIKYEVPTGKIAGFPLAKSK